MPLYHFNVYDGISLPDDVGHELPSLRDAQREAVVLSASLLRELAEDFWRDSDWRLEVADAEGRVLLKLSVVGTVHGKPARG